MKKFIFTCLTSLFIWCSSFAQCVHENKAVPDNGETLRYIAYYNLKAIWIKGGEAVFTANPVGSYYHYTVKAYTFPKWRWIYDMNTSIDAYMSKESMQPVSYASNTYENKKSHHEKFTYYKNNKIKYQTWEDKSKKVNEFVFNRPDCANDLLNAVYVARNLDLSQYKMNEDLSFNLLFTQNATNIVGQMIGRENITTKSGATYNCIKCKANSISGSIFDASEPVYVWITDDDRHIPVLVQCKIKVGYVKVYLEEVK